jgi:chromosome segregation ATPase
MSDDPTIRILAAISQLGGDIAQSRTDVSQLRADMVDRIDGLRADMGQVRADMTQLRADMIDRTDGLRADLEQLRIGMMERMDRLQNAFSSMQQDITVNFAASDRADRMVRAATDETRALADQVSAMVRQIRVLTMRVDEIDRRGDGHAKQG